NFRLMSDAATESTAEDGSGEPKGTAPADNGLGLDANLVFEHLLREAGVEEAEIVEAVDEGELHILALERLIEIEPAAYTLEEAAAMSGIDVEQIRAYWRALGFPDPRPGEKLFSETDLDMLESAVPWIEDGAVAPGLAVQMARVIGSSLSKIATAQIEAIERE